jgi:hypothetical protein
LSALMRILGMVSSFLSVLLCCCVVVLLLWMIKWILSMAIVVIYQLFSSHISLLLPYLSNCCFCMVDCTLLSFCIVAVRPPQKEWSVTTNTAASSKGYMVFLYFPTQFLAYTFCQLLLIADKKIIDIEKWAGCAVQ